jgi:hypothetical protein
MLVMVGGLSVVRPDGVDGYEDTLFFGPDKDFYDEKNETKRNFVEKYYL